MQEMIDSLLAYAREKWPELLWIVFAAGFASYFATRKARLRWKKRDFLDRLNVSLTSIEGGVLRIRTIFEEEGEKIFLNTAAAQTVVKLARQTTSQDPILPIPEEDCWQYLNAVLNEISERFSEGQIRRDLGLPVERGLYLLCLTCEKAGPVRTQKVRGMLVRKSLLANLPEQEPTYESPNHVTRWATLKQLAAQYQSRPYRFLEIEICV